MIKLKTILIITASAFAPLAVWSQETVHNVTAAGITFKVEGKGGSYTKPLPERISIPEPATTEWDGETLTLTVTATDESDPPITISTDYVLTPQEIADAWAYVPPPAVPQQVSKVQLKIALIQAGIDLDALILQLPSADQPIARILVDDADFFLRSAGMVETLGTAAGLTSEQLDDLFRAAAVIDPATL